MSAATNPYRSSRLEALAYRPAVDLVQRALDLGRSAIVGPMGTGKTTLLGELGQGLRARGLRVSTATVRRDERGCVEPPVLPGAADPGHAWLIDGLDLLAPWTRARWWWASRGAVVVVAAHRPLGLPVLHRTRPCADALASLVEELAGPSAPSRAWLEERLRARDGNAREVLFELYDGVRPD
ncbi:MAG: hypothetical protein H6735_31130 [Alphaproteobacteria bacterium]|nr:hypothetical protein [Alphaproteobacteria bacterium]